MSLKPINSSSGIYIQEISPAREPVSVYKVVNGKLYTGEERFFSADLSLRKEITYMNTGEEIQFLDGAVRQIIEYVGGEEVRVKG